MQPRAHGVLPGKPALVCPNSLGVFFRLGRVMFRDVILQTANWDGGLGKGQQTGIKCSLSGRCPEAH